jgi:hypothetical protein
MFSEIRVTKAEAVEITSTGAIRIHLHLEPPPNEYFKDWCRNPGRSFSSTTQFHPQMCNFPPYLETDDHFMSFEIAEDAMVDSVRMVRDWIPIANEYANKKYAIQEKRRQTLEKNQRAHEAEKQKRLENLNKKLENLNRKLAAP